MAVQMTATDVKRLCKQNSDGRVYVNNVGGEPWYTNTYYAAPVKPWGPFAQLVTKHNLNPYEPGTFTLNGTVSQFDQEPPDMESLVAGACENLDGASLAPRGFARLVVKGRPQYLAVFRRADGGEVNVRAEFLDAAVSGWDETYGSHLFTQGRGPNGPVVAWLEGKPVGLVMPIRLA